MAETTARQLIDSRGGCRHIAETLGWKLSTVNTWYRTNKLPEYRARIVGTLPLKNPPPPRGKWQLEQAAQQQDAA